MKYFTWIARFDVAKTWVEDGFNLTDDRALEMINKDLCYASTQELAARVISAPSIPRILSQQGYRKDSSEAHKETNAIVAGAPMLYRHGPGGKYYVNALSMALDILDSLPVEQLPPNVMTRLRCVRDLMTGVTPL